MINIFHLVVQDSLQDGCRFQLCGYATTIRRAQGADIVQGAICMDNKWHPAARGYGYVGISRFQSRAGVYLFGELRRSNFLPVGPDLESEQLERGYHSDDSDSDDGDGLEHAYSGGIAEDGDSDESDGIDEVPGNALGAVDFG